MAFWLTFFLFVGFTVIGELLRPKPKFDAPEPSGLGDFQVPTAEEGRPIPAVFGTVRLRGPNVVWYGDLAVVAIKEKVKTGLFSSTEVTKGYQYRLGQQLVLCHGPIDALLDVRYDDRPVSGRTKTFSLPTADLGDFSSIWRNSDGTTTNRWSYIDEEPDPRAQGALGGGIPIPSTNDLDYVTESAASFGSLGHVDLGTVGTPVAGATHTVSFRIRRVVVGGTQANFVVKLYQGGTLIKTMTTNAPTFFVTRSFNLTAAEVLLITDYSDLHAEFFAQGGPALDSFYVLSALAFKVSSTLTEAPAAWDSEGKMRFSVTEPNFFGGEDREGGVVGEFDIYRGSLVQVANDYLQSKIGANLPGYRGICYVVARQPYIGNSPYLKLISFTVRRLPNGLGVAGNRHDVNGDANPACVVYDILTDARWGAGIAAGQVDATSFLQAADLLHAEGLGVSMVVDSQASARDLIAEVLRHVDGTLFADPQTGMLRLALARGDYQPQDLLLLDERNVDTVKFSRPSWEQTTNVVKVRYVDRAANFTHRVAQAQDLANVEARGGEVSEEEFNFLGLSNAAAAQRAAARVLRTVSYPLAPIEVRANREAWQLRPGGLFRLRWGPYGIVDMPCRVVRMRDGDLRDGKITVDAVEDVFGVLWTAYAAPGASTWVDPIQAPSALAAALLVECPYALVVGPERLVLTLGAAGTGTPVGYQVWSDPVAQNYALTNVVGALTPSGTLTAPIDRTASSIRVAVGPGMDSIVPPIGEEFQQGGAVMLIDGEMVAWASALNNGDGTYTFGNLVRGVMDTVPAEHASGARAWFVTEGAGLVQNTPYDADVTVRAKLLPFNSKATIAIDDVAEVSLTTNQRAVRPYPPTSVLVNGASYPTLISGNITVSWKHRNRLGTWTYDNAGETAAAEVGTTYTLRFYGEDGLLKQTYSGLTGLSQEWTTEVADSGLGRLNTVVRFELLAARDGLDSFQLIDFTVWRDVAPPVWARDSQRPTPRRRPRVVRVRNTPGQ